MSVYYNDNDPYAAAWLQNLIAGGHLPGGGEVDERSIRDVRPEDLRGFGQCHFFAGIGGWPLALRLAGWPDDRPVWTGSCPCQPFSAAGKRKGTADDRHLWPEFHRLIAECRPPVVLGEQVASKDGRAWLAGVRADMEALGYGVGAADLCAAGAGAPHIRQRLWWVAESFSEREGAVAGVRQGAGAEPTGSGDGRLADADGRQSRHGHVQPGGQHGQQPEDGGAVRVGDAGGTRLAQRECDGRVQREAGRTLQGQAAVLSGDSFWSRFDLIPCADGKARRVESGLQPLAHGVPARVGRLRAYGNAIVPQVAAEFIAAYRDAR